MTEAPLPADDSPDAGTGRGPAPEIIGAAIAVIVLAVIGTAVLAGGGRPAIVAPSSSPLASGVAASASPRYAVDPAVVALLKQLDQELLASADALQKELDRATQRTPDIAIEIRHINQLVAYGSDKVKTLGGALGKNQPGGQLAAAYADIAGTAAETLKASVNNAAAYRIGAGSLIKEIEAIPPIQQALEDLLDASPPPSASASLPPASSAPPSVSPSPTPAATNTSGPTETPSGTSSASPVASGPEQLVNGGFETGVDAPWQLLVGGGAAATLVADPAAPASGKEAARVDISVSSPAYGGISLQQAGLDLEAGALYTVTLSGRAPSDRDVRIRIASAAGDSYLTRLVTFSSSWTSSSFTFPAPITDSNAILEIELGRSDITTWIDDASFRSSTLAP